MKRIVLCFLAAIAAVSCYEDAAPGKTASQAAKDLGWDETIWDLSGAEPILK